jgi:hypothetical protein
MSIWRQGTRAAASLALAALVAGGSLEVLGQDKDKEKVRTVVVNQDRVVVRGQGGGTGAGVGQGIGIGTGGGVGVGDNTFVFVSSEMIADGKVVRGAPYSAEAVTETTQVLGDGNRIVRKNTAQVYRDSEGRTRRDQIIGVIGPFAAAGDPPVTVFIHDPVGGTSYVLDPRSKTARKVNVHLTFERQPRAEGAAPPPPSAKGEGEGKPLQMKRQRSGGAYVFNAPVPPPGDLGHMPPPAVWVFSGDGSEPKVEQLEKQTIEGVSAEGTRMTHTIPAGAIGNEQPINIVDERWYSPELQTTVMTRHSDPRSGETVYRLTNINRTEPARTLFEVPSDYTLKESGNTYTRTFKRRAGPGEKENFQFHFSPGPEQQ